MRILALQLKRIGDLILTTPALAALKAAHPQAHLTLGVNDSTSGLLPMIESIDSAVVFGQGRGWAPWQQVLTGGFDAVLDFTGTDRSALAAVLSLARQKIAFESLRKKKVRALAFREFVDSSVRERHTADHYMDLAAPLLANRPDHAQPILKKAVLQGVKPFVMLHPGTARPEKYWLPDRWAEVGKHLIERHGYRVRITTGPDPFEQAHAAEIQSAIRNPQSAIVQPIDLESLASYVASAALVVSCDTAVVHFGAAYERPQITLFGPTNPFHWRPRHDRAVVISASKPEEPLTEFSPRMNGAPMEHISTGVVCRAIDTLLEDPKN